MDSDLRQWKEVMGALLNTCVERGCESLLVHNGNSPLQTFTRTDPQSRVRIIGANNILQRTKSLFTNNSNAISPTTKNGSLGRVTLFDLVHLSKGARNSSQLKHLHISSRMLLHPPCSHWTYSILQTSNLTSLHLYSIQETNWAHIFSWLSVGSQLKQLSIELCYGLPTMPLIDFVVGLRALTHLKLAYPVPIVSDQKLATTWKLSSGSNSGQVLPNLVSLHAFPDWIQLLCPGPSSQSTISSLSRRLHLRRTINGIPSPNPPSPPPSQAPSRPKIGHLHILPRVTMSSRGEFDFSLSLRILRPVLESSAFSFSSPNFRLGLELYDTYTITHMARDIVQYGGVDSQALDLDIEPTPVITFGPWAATATPSVTTPPEPRPARLPRRRAQRPAGYEAYDRITELVVCNWGILQERQCRVVCEFFSMWKSVRRVKFRSIVLDAWKDENVRMLMEEARVSCQNVKEFVLGGKVYIVDDFEGDEGVEVVQAPKIKNSIWENKQKIKSASSSICRLQPTL
ncbi:hypothetical protein BDN72DRAFT_833561 [Pluteus cervinus]|uniref:Uncharacterized protein n=1 Tax=Pluteus cervinus TaxID=181527 RepID=A0ACD3B960_9AGAR|nr:hypothetical protein BDN72DRAFT_833561 [Pluteus cervinus]